jgi:hypothetical protein
LNRIDLSRREDVKTAIELLSLLLAWAIPPSPLPQSPKDRALFVRLRWHCVAANRACRTVAADAGDDPFRKEISTSLLTISK